ncbi:MAG: hypothetical protein E7319_05215 [Clostridiales bacterium]|nr:hypothetical protein [Clostridiales bacterium]
MKKSVFLIVAVLILTMILSFAAQAEALSAQDVLFTEKWTGLSAGSSLFVFNPDGTGKLEINGGDDLDTVWSVAGDQVTVEYNLYGQRSFTYTFKQENGVYALTTADGGMLVRVSDCERLLAESRASLNAYPVAKGEQINLGFVSMSVDSSVVLRKLQGSSGSGIFMQPVKGNKLFVAKGTMSNLGGSEINIWNIKAEITLDDAYTYSARCYVEVGGDLQTELSAQNTGEINIFAEIPDAIAESYTTAKVYFAFNDRFASSPMTISDGDFIFEVAFDQQDAATAKEGAVRQKVYFEESPALAKPMSYVDMREAGHSSSKSNNKYTRIEYRFAPEFNEDSIIALKDAYLLALSADGYTVKGDEIYLGKTLLATISLDRNNMEISVKPGNEALTPPQATPVDAASAAAQAAPQEEEGPAMLHLGDTIRTDDLEMTLAKQETGTIYSSIKPRSNGYYQYIEGVNGNELFYLTGTFKNLSGEPVDIGNIYGEVTFDDKYTYRGNVEGAASEANIFIRDVAPLNEVTYFLYAEVPSELLASYERCIVRIGFTEDFGIKFSTSGGLLNFDHCDEVYVVDLSKGAAAGASAAESGYRTLQPGCEGQDVLDARMKMYELGYFNNKPTQTDYTSNMMKYVKEFEKDFGLTQDGILSPEDQEVLFAQ